MQFSRVLTLFSVSAGLATPILSAVIPGDCLCIAPSVVADFTSSVLFPTLDPASQPTTEAAFQQSSEPSPQPTTKASSQSTSELTSAIIPGKAEDVITNTAISAMPSTNYTTCQTEQAYHPFKVTHQFPSGGWVANIHVLQNDRIILTSETSPNLYILDPGASSQGPGSGVPAAILHTFPQGYITTGITEAGKNRIHVIAGKYNINKGLPKKGSFEVFLVDLTHYNFEGNSGAQVVGQARIPWGAFLTGMTTLDYNRHTFVIADSADYSVLVYDAPTNIAKYEWIQVGSMNIPKFNRFDLLSPLVTPPESFDPGPRGFKMGVKGLKILDTGDDIVWLYYCNPAKELFARVPVSRSKQKKKGDVQILLRHKTISDFALDPEGGYAYLADAMGHQLLRVPIDGGEAETIAGGPDDELLPGPTSVALGVGDQKGKIYVGTNGAVFSPVHGWYTEGGKVMEFNIAESREGYKSGDQCIPLSYQLSN